MAKLILSVEEYRMTKPYHASIANRIATLASVSTMMDLGRAAGFAELGQITFVPPADRADVIDSLTDLHAKVSRATLKNVDKTAVMNSIDLAISAIGKQPDKLVQTNGVGGGHATGHEADSRPSA